MAWRRCFPHYCPFVMGVHQSPVNSPGAGDFRRHDAHVTSVQWTKFASPSEDCLLRCCWYFLWWFAKYIKPEDIHKWHDLLNALTVNLLFVLDKPVWGNGFNFTYGNLPCMCAYCYCCGTARFHICINTARWHLRQFQEAVWVNPLSLIQWNLSVTTTSIMKSITCDLFSNVF